MAVLVARLIYRYGVVHLPRAAVLFTRTVVLIAENNQHPVYQFEPPLPTLHEYRSVNVYNFKVFYYIDGERVIIYRIRHLLSDFSHGAW